MAMDIGLDHDSWLRRAPPARDGTPSRPSFDWQGLAARLNAAYTLRRSLAAKDIYADAPSGSFDEEAAGALAGYTHSRGESWRTDNDRQEKASRAVNPIALEDRKPASGIHGVVAGPNASGDRGLI